MSKSLQDKHLIVWKCYDCQADESCRKELAYIIQISTGPIRTICYHMSYATPFGEFLASERCRINVCENAAWCVENGFPRRSTADGWHRSHDSRCFGDGLVVGTWWLKCPWFTQLRVPAFLKTQWQLLVLATWRNMSISNRWSWA